MGTPGGVGIADATTRLAGMDFPHLDLEGAAHALLSPLGRKTALPWRLVNTFNISLLRSDHDYAATLRGEGINLPDGKPVAWALRWLGRRAGARTAPAHVRGPAFFGTVLALGRGGDVGHFLRGGSPEPLDALVGAIEQRWPGARIVGAESPPFRDLSP